MTAEIPLGDLRADTVIEYAGTKAKVAIEAKQRVNAATAWQLVNRAGALPVPMLVVAGETTEDARQILRDHAIGVVDGRGRAHIELPGLLVHIDNALRTNKPKAPPTRLRGKAGLAAQALLLEPTRDWRVQDLAERARVSIGMAHRVLARLEQDGVVEAEGAGPARIRRVQDPTALLDLFAEEANEHPRRTLAYLLAQTPRQLIEELGRNLDRAGVECALTGAAAASMLAPFLTAVPAVHVWVRDAVAPEELYDGAQSDPVIDGANVIFLQARADAPLAFREQTEGVWVANRFRVYADLLDDPRRGKEQAQKLREEVIGF